jgi:hypothetical protein
MVKNFRPCVMGFLKLTMQYTLLINQFLTGLNPTELTVEDGPNFLKPSFLRNKGILLQLMKG